MSSPQRFTLFHLLQFICIWMILTILLFLPIAKSLTLVGCCVALYFINKRIKNPNSALSSDNSTHFAAQPNTQSDVGIAKISGQSILTSADSTPVEEQEVHSTEGTPLLTRIIIRLLSGCCTFIGVLLYTVFGLMIVWMIGIVVVGMNKDQRHAVMPLMEATTKNNVFLFTMLGSLGAGYVFCAIGSALSDVWYGMNAENRKHAEKASQELVQS